MTYQITKTFGFAASHWLDGLSPEHKCSRLHGHNYLVTVCLDSVGLDPVGMVRDYGDLAPFGNWLASTVDHRHLGPDDLWIARDGQEPRLFAPAVFTGNPTAENLADHLRTVASSILGTSVPWVEVQEGPVTSARVGS